MTWGYTISLVKVSKSKFPVLAILVIVALFLGYLLHSGILLTLLWNVPFSPLKALIINYGKTNGATLANCDQNLWSHVYEPERLYVINTCKEISGVVSQIEKEDDGDMHLLLKLDSDYANASNFFNRFFYNNDLVIEVICYSKSDSGIVVKSCRDYKSEVDIPKVGEHVKIKGSYVIDIPHGWMEIHPVSTIEVI